MSIVLTGLPNLHRGTMKKKKKGRERQEVLWPDTHAIAIVNIHTKIALSESVKVNQISSLVSPE